MGMADGKKITITRDGPYEVSGDVPLHRAVIETDANGDSVAWKEDGAYATDDGSYCLCRCGRSRTKPFCDGTHDDAGFCGHEHAQRPTYRENAQLQRGEKVDLLDDPTLCVGARFCDRGETVWGYVERSGDPENRKMAIDEACKCPAGRLTVIDENGRPLEPDLPKEIGVVDDPANDCRGPLWVKGGIEIEGAAGEKYETRNRVALCRCGESRNQPYCDGTHYQCEWMQGNDTMSQD